MEKNYFEALNLVNVSEKIEKKNGLSYLSWAFAWGELKKLHPTANYKVYENVDGCIYFHDNKTAWVKTSVTVNELEHIEYLPIMDFKNKSIAIDAITSFDVNKAIQRCVTKAIARHGLGLFIYAGEDLPEAEPTEKKLTEAQKLFNDAVAKKLSPDWNAIKAKHNVKTSEELTSKQIDEIRKELSL